MTAHLSGGARLSGAVHAIDDSSVVLIGAAVCVVRRDRVEAWSLPDTAAGRWAVLGEPEPAPAGSQPPSQLDLKRRAASARPPIEVDWEAWTGGARALQLGTHLDVVIETVRAVTAEFGDEALAPLAGVRLVSGDRRDARRHADRFVVTVGAAGGPEAHLDGDALRAALERAL
ncbi:MAG: hypothetical protein ACRBI6_20330 [Acidimicrobiales bacterium]